MSETNASGSDALSVDDIIITEELARRPSRAPDGASEARALGLLAHEMATNPDGVLRRCARLALELCRADSAGISILEPGGPNGILRWHAAEGAFAANLYRTIPREASPCGIVIARDGVILFRDPGRSFPALTDLAPPMHESLLVPWHSQGESVGTLWAIKHSSESRFDAEDARLLQSLARFASAAFQMTDALRAARAREEELRASEERLRLITESARGYAIYFTDPQDRVTDWLPGAAAVFGWTEEEIVGRPAAILYTAEDREAGVPEREVEAARNAGVAPDVGWHLRRDGSRVFIEGSVAALRRPDGSPRGFLKVGRDITKRHAAERDLRASEARAKMLLAELQHRVRNTLSVVRSIARRSAETSESVEEYAMHLEGRITAFARVQAAATRDPAGGVDLGMLVADELLSVGAHEGEQVRSIRGPGIRLKPKAAETLGLAIHELATNAVKYGALSTKTGRITVDWSLETRPDQRRLVVRWFETGVHLSGEEPRRRGFGTELIERSLAYQLGGEASLSFEQDGLRCVIALPADDEIFLEKDPISRDDP